MNNIEELYSLRNDFLILGLTGRTGSGYTTTAELLSKKSFEDVGFPQPSYSNYSGNDERKYRISYEYLEKNWNSFFTIRASDIIISIVLDDSIDTLFDFLKNKFSGNSQKLNKVKSSIGKDFIRLKKLKDEINAIDESDPSLIKQKKDLAYNFYFNSKLKEFTDSIKTEIQEIRNNDSLTPFQLFGINIRSSGSPFRSEISSENCFRISKITNKLIKTIRDKNGGKACIVIDSIRNSLEAAFFKERFSAFYLLAINTENEHRENRLNVDTIRAIDLTEYKTRKGNERFIHQDLPNCIQAADIYLYNPNEKDGDSRKELKKQLVKYLSLIKHPGLITPSPEERCMQFSYTAKYNSGCISRQVGAVVTDSNYSIKSVGWNNTAEGQTPCLLRSTKDLTHESDDESFSRYERSDVFRETMKANYNEDSTSEKLKGRNHSYCFKDEYNNCITGVQNQVHTRSLHAEENAFLQLTKYGGEGIKNGFLFTTASPCELCSKKAYQLGIKKVFYIDPYPGIAIDHIIHSGDIETQPTLILFSGAIGRAYHQLYEPFIPYKDELKTLLKS